MDNQLILIVSTLIFALGVFGIYYHRYNLLRLFCSGQLIIFAAITNMISFSQIHGNIEGQMFAAFALLFLLIEVLVIAILILQIKNSDRILTTYEK